MLSTNRKRITLEDITPEKIEQAQQIVRYVVLMQTLPALANAAPLLNAIATRSSGLHAGLHDGLHDGLRAELNQGLRKGLNSGLSDGLHKGLRNGLCDGLNDGLSAELNQGLHHGLHDGLSDGLDDGLSDGLRDGLHDGLSDGLDDGLYDGLRDGLDDGLHDGLSDGLDDGLSDGLRDGLDDGLREGLHQGLSNGLYDGLDAGLYAGLNVGLNHGLRHELRENFESDNFTFYCGVWWSWWLARYLIAQSWGCPLDSAKLNTLHAFCVACPLVGIIKKEDREHFLVLPKPTKISWVEQGLTTGKIPLPVYELHADGEPAVEHPMIKPLYFWHNIKLPEYIGKTKSSAWKPEWVATEKNAEVKRILIQELGYERILQELGGKKLDSYREYELVSLSVPDSEIDYRVLKMTCPSTGHLHCLRVPPDMTSAEDAITWCNWGVKPSEFRVEH